jgi:predicted nucleic acid-binding protein
VTGSRRRAPAALSGPVYCDASALVKLYVPEEESEELNRVLEGRRDLLLSDLSVTEIVSSLSRRRREGSLEPAVALRIHRAVLDHMERGIYRRVELIPAAHREAERLLMSVESVPLRAADALHLALAVGGEAVSIVSFDRRLSEAARAIGLVAYP